MYYNAHISNQYNYGYVMNMQKKRSLLFDDAIHIDENMNRLFGLQASHAAALLSYPHPILVLFGRALDCPYAGPDKGGCVLKAIVKHSCEQKPLKCLYLTPIDTQRLLHLHCIFEIYTWS